MSRFAGVHVATTTPFRPGDLGLDLDRYQTHVAWLLDQGVDGLVPVGSLGEYESLTAEERRAVVEATVEVSDGRVPVVPGVSGTNASVAVTLTEHAAAVGADGVMALPPTNHPATDAELDAHFAAIAAVGLPVVAYNNPFSTRTDLTPQLLARLAEIDGIVAVKEFSGDVRRVSEILELAPSLEVICGADDVALESALMGATGWIGGFTGVFPRETIEVFQLGRKGNVDEARVLYRRLLPAMRWDTTPRFVEAIKLAIDLVGAQGGGEVRPPRLRLTDADASKVQAAVAAVRGVDA